MLKNLKKIGRKRLKFSKILFNLLKYRKIASNVFKIIKMWKKLSRENWKLMNFIKMGLKMATRN